MEDSSKITYAQPSDPTAKKILIKGVELLTGKPKITKVYDKARASMKHHNVSFWQAAIGELGVNLNFSEEALDNIPKEGPILIVSNHPFGVLDGMILCYLASKIRSSFKILINSVLCELEELSQHFLPIDFNETKEALKTNIASKNTALEELRRGGVVIIFPAGGVSTAASPFSKKIIDTEWKTFTAKLIKMTKATVVPFYFHGANSRAFQLASHLSLTLRLSLLLHEVKNKMGKAIRVEIGKPIPYNALSCIKNRKDMMVFLRAQTYGLAN